MTRSQAYKWLSQKLGTEPDQTHIGMFDVSLCQQTIALCSARSVTRVNLQALIRGRSARAS
jgi:hypothetical protein